VVEMSVVPCKIMLAGFRSRWTIPWSSRFECIDLSAALS
jgi:hypothetical protein